jgi:hypothetical protein
MVAAIRQQVIVQAGGRIEVQSPDLTPGARADVIILLTTQSDRATTTDATSAPPQPPAQQNSGWRRHAGALHGGDPGSSDNERIDADLAREYGSDHEPPA